MRHTITADDLDEWLRTPRWQRFASSFGNGSAKFFEVDEAGGVHAFRVVDHGETVFLGADLAKAITAYNSAR